MKSEEEYRAEIHAIVAEGARQQALAEGMIAAVVMLLAGLLAWLPSL